VNDGIGFEMALQKAGLTTQGFENVENNQIIKNR